MRYFPYRTWGEKGQWWVRSMCQDGLPAAFRAEKKRAVTYDSFNRLVVYSLWLWTSEFCDKFSD